MSSLDLHGMVYGPGDQDRLCLFYVPRGDGWDFHSIVWEQYIDGTWKLKVSITQEAIQGSHAHRRWVSELFSLDPERGWATMKAAEGNRPEGPPFFAVSYAYSWRIWDLLGNREIGRLKDCVSPFDPL